MDYSFFAFISRMKNIDCWSLMRNSFRENLQEHSHMVAVLAHALAVIGRDIFGKDTDPNAAAAAALFHDASEILTGDMPTPVKYYGNGITAVYKQVEKIAAQKLVGTLPPVMQNEYAALLDEESSPQRDIIKAADRLAAYIKCLEELRAGNEEFRSAANQTRRKLETMELPEVDYFLNNFIHAFEMTLDELDLNN